MTSSNQQCATVGRNISQKLTMSQDFAINREPESSSKFNKPPPSSVINNDPPLEFITLQPAPPSSYQPPSTSFFQPPSTSTFQPAPYLPPPTSTFQPAPYLPPLPSSIVLQSVQTTPLNFASLYTPLGGSRIKQVISKVRRIPATCMETLCYTNLVDQDISGIKQMDDGIYITVAFQTYIDPLFKRNFVKLAKSRKL